MKQIYHCYLFLSHSSSCQKKKYLSIHTEQGLINGLGQLSRMLFGNAMNKDVVELRENFNQLASYASAQNNYINLTL